MICGTSSFHGLNEFFYVMNMGEAKLIWLALPIYFMWLAQQIADDCCCVIRRNTVS